MFSSFSVAIGEAVCSLVKDTIATLHDVVRALSHKRRYGRYLRQCRSGNNGEESLFLGSDTASSQYLSTHSNTSKGKLHMSMAKQQGLSLHAPESALLVFRNSRPWTYWLRSTHSFTRRMG
jgi:hypothetical protein